MWESFVGMLMDGTLFRGFIAVVAIVTSAIMVYQGVQPPDWWTLLVGSVVAFYFTHSAINGTVAKFMKARDEYVKGLE